jgi:hypothetical protein
MSDTAFESRISAVFARLEQRLGGRLSVEKAKAENLQSQDTRRVAFILTEAIEAEIKPVLKEALVSYDEAINRPLVPNERWEHALLQRAGLAVDQGVKLALNLDRADHPWKPLLAAEAPKLRARVLAVAEAHFAELGQVRKRRRRKPGEIPDWAVGLALFLGGTGAGLLLGRLLHG